MKFKRLIIAFSLVLTLVCASAVEAAPDSQNRTGAAEDRTSAGVEETVNAEEYLDFLKYYARLLEDVKENNPNKNIVTPDADDVNEIIEDLEENLVVGTDGIGDEQDETSEVTSAETSSEPVTETTQPETEATTSDPAVAPAEDGTSGGTVSDDGDNDGGSSAGLVVVIVLLVVILAAVSVVAFVPGVRDIVVGVFDPKHGKKGKKRSHSKNNKPAGQHEPQDAYDVQDYSREDRNAGQGYPHQNQPNPQMQNPQGSQRRQYDVDDMTGYGSNVPAYEEPVQMKQEEKPAPPPPDLMQVSIADVMRCYRGEDVDVSGWRWYDIVKESLRSNAAYLNTYSEGYDALVYSPATGNRNGYQYALLCGKYLFPSFYFKGGVSQSLRNSSFAQVADETGMKYIFKFTDENNNDYRIDKNSTRFEIVHVEPALAKIDSDTGNLKVVTPGRIVFR